MVEIREVKTRRQLNAFVKFPTELYKDCEQYIPDLLSDERSKFTAKNNPDFDVCDARCFLAYKEGKLVGRVAAIVSHKANEKWGTKRIRFSRLDFIDDLEVSRALIEAVEQWGRELGLEELHGPLGFTDMDPEGMLVDGFDTVSLFITIYNYPYYVKHMEALGFVKDVDWVEYRVKVPDRVDPRLEKLRDIVLKRSNLTMLHPKNRKEIKPFVRPVLGIVNKAYENLYGTIPLTQAQIEKYYHQFILMINPKYVVIVQNADKEAVGFGLAVPSMNEAVKKSNGRLFPFGWYRVLRAPFKKAKVLDLYLIGVIPEMQKRGLTAILLSEITRTAIEDGIEYAETGPELETNENVQSMWKNYEAEQHKRRRCWIKPL